MLALPRGYSTNLGFRSFIQVFARETSPAGRPGTRDNEWYSQGGLVSWTAITGVENAIIRALEKVEKVAAIFCEQDLEDGVLRIFTVIDEHDPDTYDLILRAEDEFEQRIGHLVRLAFRVCAHQGRQPRHVVPVGTNPIYIR